jgi:predicted TIM-barrel fold metal-dependent hydrolase
MSTSRWISSLAVPLVAAVSIAAQDSAPPPPAKADDPAALSFMAYDPPSTLVVPQHPVARARYPFIDVHNHQFDLDSDAKVAAVVQAMDAMNMAVMVNLSGRGFRRTTDASGAETYTLQDPQYLRDLVARTERVAPGRMVHFTNVEWDGAGGPGWAERAVRELEADVAAGARGLKIYKSLGMEDRDASGARLHVDDPRLDPIFEACARLGIPVLIHTADPAPFWQQRDKNNERLYELIEIPDRWRDPAKSPAWETLVEEQHGLFRRHPRTRFIAAHLGWLGNDLGRLGKLLDEMPNVSTEIGAVLAELGRQPRFAREWLVRYQDRVMFGKDSWQAPEYPAYFRVLETADDYFPYYRRRHAFWKIYGLDLPDEVLRKLYYENALALVPKLDRARFPAAR